MNTHVGGLPLPEEHSWFVLDSGPGLSVQCSRKKRDITSLCETITNFQLTEMMGKGISIFGCCCASIQPSINVSRGRLFFRNVPDLAIFHSLATAVKKRIMKLDNFTYLLRVS